MSTPDCTRCATLTKEVGRLREQLREVIKLADLQKADLARLREAQARPQENRPERASVIALQLALDRILVTEEAEHAQEAAPTSDSALALAEITEAAAKAAAAAKEREAAANAGQKKKRKVTPHGRRIIDLASLPKEVIVIDPEPVIASGGVGWEYIGDELGSRLAVRKTTYIELILQRRKYRLAGGPSTQITEDADERTEVLVASIPDNIWPLYMADPSVIARHILSKFSDCLPMHRQETISAREGFRIPRSTQCGWMSAAYGYCHRVVDAMLHESRSRAFCIATDATGAPVRAPKKNALWHVFVLLADRDHVVFRHAKEHTSATVRELLQGFKGHVLADAATVFDTLYEDGSVIEVACWFHLRRYFWRGIATEPERAYEALALIARLFEVERGCRDVPMPERTTVRAERARPILRLLDSWVSRYRDKVDPRGPVDAAIGYYMNQRTALHRFLEDGRLRLDNNLSEQALRHLVLGRRNWTHFANETGLRWYTTFRSLIASCSLHRLNPASYMEQLLRLAPHWPVNRVLELSPRYWTSTIAKLDDRQKSIILSPWETGSRIFSPPIALAA